MCNFSPDSEGRCAGEVQSVAHIFQQCTRATDAWSWMSEYINNLLLPRKLSDEDCLNLMYEPLSTGIMEDTVTWLLGTYYEYMLRETVEKNREMSRAEMEGYLRQRYVTYRRKKTGFQLLPGW